MGNPVLVDEATVRGTAAEAWIWGLPMLENYRTLYARAVDDADPRHVGGFGVFRHYPHSGTPADTDLVTPDGDTPYSLAWLDLRTEPWVLEVPAADRYHVLPLHDLDTCYVGFVGTRTTGNGAGRHLVLGPDHRGTSAEGFDGVLQADTRLVGIVGRTHLAGPEDVPALEQVQAGYRLRPLSAHLGTEPPPPAPDPVWPVWREEVLDSLEFFSFLDFLLGFFPVLPADADLRRRLAELGVGTGDFEPAALPLEIRAAMAAGIADARTRLGAAVAGSHGSTALFGTRAQLGTDHLGRAIGVQRGLYGLPVEEVWYTGWTTDDGSAEEGATGDGHDAGHAEDTGHTGDTGDVDVAEDAGFDVDAEFGEFGEYGRPLDGSARSYTLRFPPGSRPPARYFWSVTVYGLPDRWLVANPIGRYAIGDRTPGLLADEDGGLTLRLRHERPEEPGASANWLPVPAGPFMVVLRAYGPEPTVLDGRWQRPPLIADR
ncbi:DUF1254 domain-containing protein [Streptomyces sp. NRRL B-24484]|uniref:DUF1254 domain-containing protein n=1 Tax=Streptomyces sp. NRRL B-24484 TaxID=1463833 RepID=UPI0005BA4E0A|nr:DUF1254 domain-containing protein [Streptomyces sp. NRRL B-24484]